MLVHQSLKELPKAVPELMAIDQPSVELHDWRTRAPQQATNKKQIDGLLLRPFLDCCSTIWIPLAGALL